MFLCMYVRTYVCMYVCMYLSMYGLCHTNEIEATILTYNPLMKLPDLRVHC